MQIAQTGRDHGRARARLVIEDLTRRLLSHAAGRRQGVDRGTGARAPAGMAAPRRTLAVITEQRTVTVLREREGLSADVVEVPVTPLGYQTALRELPPILAALSPGDPRRRAAAMIGDAFERIGAIRGADLGGDDIKGGKSDGGVTTRIKHATRLRLIEARVNLWPVDPVTGQIRRLRERVVLRVRRQRGSAREIRAFPLLIEVCVEGRDMGEILRRHGWSTHSKHRKDLAAATLELLDLFA